MTESMSDLLATDSLLTALAERRPLGSHDVTVDALIHLTAALDAAPFPELVLPQDPSALPFVRRAGVAVAAMGVLAFSSSGLAAAVTGDPLLPLRYVVGKLYEHGHGDDRPDPDRLFVGQASDLGNRSAATESGRVASERPPRGDVPWSDTGLNAIAPGMRSLPLERRAGGEGQDDSVAQPAWSGVAQGPVVAPTQPETEDPGTHTSPAGTGSHTDPQPDPADPAEAPVGNDPAVEDPAVNDPATEDPATEDPADDTPTDGDDVPLDSADTPTPEEETTGPGRHSTHRPIQDEQHTGDRGGTRRDPSVETTNGTRTDRDPLRKPASPRDVRIGSAADADQLESTEPLSGEGTDLR